MYGERDDPASVVTALGRRLDVPLGPGAALLVVAEMVAIALKLPAVMITLRHRDGGIAAARYPPGDPDAGGADGMHLTHTLPLTYAGETVGELRVAPRPGETDRTSSACRQPPATGADVTAGCGVFDPDTGIKGWAGGANVRPTVSLCDPGLTTSMPPRVTADTGFDALSQAIEAIVTLQSNPYADALLLTAVETIGRYLPKAFANGANLEARAAMLGAATMVGTAFPFGGLMHVHTYAELLDDLTHLPHGRLIGLMLPHVLEWSAIGCPEKLVQIARALGENVDGLSTHAGAERALAAVRRLCAELEMDERLRSHNVSPETLHICAERVFSQHTPRSVGGPGGFRNVDEVLSVLKRAY